MTRIGQSEAEIPAAATTSMKESPSMLGQLTPHLAYAHVDDRVRTARERRVTRVTPPSPTPAGSSDAHERQRRLVSASLLLSPRSDRPTSRRWA